MILLVKFCAFLLLILVGYHYINEPLGFSIAGSIATAILALCLLSIYRSYQPDAKNWLGWLLICSGCLLLSAFNTFSVFLLLPILLLAAGYHLAELPWGGLSSIGGDSGPGDSGGGFDSCNGGSD